jgi:predicted PurR-regulated permease PerM
MAEAEQSQPPRAGITTHTLRTVLIVAAVAYLLYLVRSILPVFLVSLLLAYVLAPLLDRLEKRGWRRGWGVALVYAGFLLFFAVVVILVLPPIVTEVGSLASSVSEYPAKLVTMWSGYFGEGGGARSPLAEQAASFLRTHGDRLAAGVAQWLNRMLQAARGSVAVIFSFLLLPIITYYFVRDLGEIRRAAREILPRRYKADVVETVGEVERMLGRYLRAQFVVSLAISVSAALLLSVWQLAFHVRYALLLGVLAGFLCVIPMVGALTLWVLVGLVAYLTGSPPVWAMVASVGSLVALNQVFDNIVTPRLMGEAVGVHPLWIIFALMVGGHLLGLVGMLIAVPAAATVQIVVRHSRAQAMAAGTDQASDHC